jgi:hypothetical protein
MPRLLPGGPGLGVSPDHAWLIIAHEGKLTVVDTATRKELRSVELPFSGETDLVVTAQKRLLAFVRLESSTALCAFTLPQLEPMTTMEMIGRAHPLATMAEQVFVVGEAGDLPRVVMLTAKVLNADPIGVREPVQLGAAAPDDCLLVAARDQIECWDPLRRRAMYRLNLPVQKPKFAGFSSRRRLLWIASEGPLGPLEVFRFSDGRLQARAELGKRILGVDGHPESPRLVVGARAEGKPPELTQFDLAVGERYPITVEGEAAAFAVVDGHKPVLVVGRAGGAIDWVALPRSTPLEEPEPKKRAADPQSPTGPHALADKLASWRNRFAGDAKSERREVRADVRRDPPRPTARPERAAEEPAREEPAREETRGATPPVEHLPIGVTGWRDALCAWAQAALDARGHAAAAPPIDEATPLGLAIARLHLQAGSARGLALLYGHWLLGEGARGLSALALAQVIGADGDEPGDEGAWPDALGRGPLARTGVARGRRGRVRLVAVAGRFLDGHAPRIQLVAAPAGAQPTELGASAVVALDRAELDSHAEGLAKQLGRAVALVALDGLDGGRERRRVAAGLVEARLHGALPLLFGGRDPASWVDLLEGDPALVAVDGEVPDELAELPHITLA